MEIEMKAEEIAAGLGAEERRLLVWWIGIDAKQGMAFTRNTPAMESLHRKKLIWSPFWLAATAPPWMCSRPRLLAVWRWLNRSKWTWWIPNLIYRIPRCGPTKLGRAVAALVEG